MTIKMGHELFGPDTAGLTGGRPEGVSGGGGSQAPLWGVGNPVAVAMAGLADQVSSFAETWDNVQASNYLLRANQQLDEMYNNPETGQFYTRKGAAAQGIYNGLIEAADSITNEATKTLSTRARGMLTNSLSTLFTDWGHKVASFETTELMNAHKEQIEVNQAMARDSIAKNGNLDPQTLGLAYSQIQQNNMDMAKIEGHSEEWVVQKTRDDFGSTVAKAAIAHSIIDPTAAYGALRSYKDVIPADKYNEALAAIIKQWNVNVQQEFWNRYLRNGAADADQYLYEVSMSGRAADYAAKWEVDGSHTENLESTGKAKAVRYEKDGRVSLGYWQIHESNMPAFANYLSAKGKSEVADALKGKKGKELEEAWIKLVDEEKLSKQDQFGFVQQEIVDKTLATLPEELQSRINHSSVYLDALWSTAVQHGQPVASKLLKKAWKDSGMDNRLFFDKLFEERANQVSGVSDETLSTSDKANILKRYKRENQMLTSRLEVGADGVARFPRDELVLDPRTEITLLRQMQAYEKAGGREAARLLKEEAPNSFSTFLMTGDKSAMDDTQAKIVETGDAKAYQTFMTQRAIYEDIRPFMNSINGLDFTTQRGLTYRELQKRTIYGPEGNSAQMTKAWNDIDKIYDKWEAEAKKDPVGYADQIRVQRAMQLDPNSQQFIEQLGGTTPEMQVSENKRIQRGLFANNLKFQPRTLSAERKKAIKADLESAPSDDQRFAMLVDLASDMGMHTDAALQELEINGGQNAAIMMAQQLEEQYYTDAKKLFIAASIPDSEVFGREERRKTDYEDAAVSNPFVQFATKAYAATHGDSENWKERSSLVDTIARQMVMDEITGDNVVKRLTDAYLFSTSNNTHIRIAKHLAYDQSHVDRGAQLVIKNQLPQRVGVIPEEVRKQISAADEEGMWLGLQQRAKAISIGDGSQVIFVSDGFVLSDKQGRPLVLSAKELADIRNQVATEYTFLPDKETRAALREWMMDESPIFPQTTLGEFLDPFIESAVEAWSIPIQERYQAELEGMRARLKGTKRFERFTFNREAWEKYKDQAMSWEIFKAIFMQEVEID